MIFWLGVVLSFLCPIVLPTQSNAYAASNHSGVLGRTVRLGALSDDFEDKDWHYDYNKHTCYRNFWRGEFRGEPELLARVETPEGGKAGSTGSLEMRTKDDDNDGYPDQEDLLTGDFSQKLGRKLTRADQPVFIVRVWLPSFDQWTRGDIFGFRTAHPSADEYYLSIWLRYDQRSRKPFFTYRLLKEEAPAGFIPQSGLWTLAIAFDESGTGHCYASPGIKNPAEGDEICTATTARMGSLDYGFFSLGYSVDRQKPSLGFIIDDYEVWIVDSSVVPST